MIRYTALKTPFEKIGPWTRHDFCWLHGRAGRIWPGRLFLASEEEEGAVVGMATLPPANKYERHRVAPQCLQRLRQASGWLPTRSSSFISTAFSVNRCMASRSRTSHCRGSPKGWREELYVSLLDSHLAASRKLTCKVAHGRKQNCSALLSSLGFRVGRQSYSNFLVSTLGP